LDEVKIYGIALTAAQVAGTYAAANAGLPAAQVIPAVVAGVSQVATTDVVVLTDAPGYDLALQQDHDLLHTDAATTIAAIGPAIASPGLWTEGTTKGLGFSLVSGTSIPVKWGTSPSYKYAAVPGSATTFYGRSGANGNVAEKTGLQFRLDTVTNQKSGAYSNTVVITATARP
jgi:hypothetical protein